MKEMQGFSILTAVLNGMVMLVGGHVILTGDQAMVGIVMVAVTVISSLRLLYDGQLYYMDMALALFYCCAIFTGVNFAIDGGDVDGLGVLIAVVSIVALIRLVAYHVNRD